MDADRRVPDIEVIAGPGAVEAGGWNASLPGGDMYLTHEWLSTVDGAVTDTSALVRVRSPGCEPVAGLAAYRLERDVFPFYDPPYLLLTEDGVEELLEALTDAESAYLHRLLAEAASVREQAYPVAVCVAPFGYTTSVWLDSAACQSTVDTLLDAFEKQALAWGARSLAFLYVPERGLDPVAASLARRGYLSRLQDASCVLPLRWPSFGEYVASFPRKRRAKIRHEVREFARAGLEVNFEDGTSLWDNQMCERLAHLAALVYEKHGHGFDPERELDALHRIRRNCQPYLRLLLIRTGAVVVAFHLFYEVDDVLFSAIVGRDPQLLSGAEYAYFNLLYEVVRYGIEHGAREVNFGSGAYAAKLHRGCKLRRLNTFVRMPDPDAKLPALLALQDHAQRRLLDRYLAGLSPTGGQV